MWVDLFEYLHTNGYQLWLGAGTNNLPAAESVEPLIDPGTDQDMLFINDSIYAAYWRPGAYDFGSGTIQLGGVLTIEYIDGQWQPTANGFTAYDPLGELLVNQQIRVRCILGSEWSESGSEPIIGLGSAAFIFFDSDTNEYIKGVQFAQFHQQSAWTEQPGPGVASNWFTYTIQPEDFADPSDTIAFFGIGTLGGNPDAGGPTSQYAMFEWQIWVGDAPEPVDSMNCDCDCGYPTRTLAEMRWNVAVEMGYATQVEELQAGVARQIDRQLNFQQRRVIEDLVEIQSIRYFSWELEPGVTKYCTTDNLETCRNQLNASRIFEAYIKNLDGQIISRLHKGIPYGLHSGGDLARSMPSRYEVRSCIEIWPPPMANTNGLRLVVLGQLGATDMVNDTDMPSASPDLVEMRTIAFLKERKGHPDAATWMQQYKQSIGILNGDQFIDERHVPDTTCHPYVERLTHVMEPRVYDEDDTP